jgi:hypothetical protein
MPDLNIRNIPKDLMMKLKVDAATAGVTLREHALGLLNGTASEVPSARAIRKDHTVPPTPKFFGDTVGTYAEKHHPRCSCSICKPPEPISRTQRKRG